MLASVDGRIDVTELRRAIAATGDSVVVAGDAWLARVHVHGERPDEAIAAGLRFGRLSGVAIRDLDDQVAHSHAAEVAPVPAPARRADRPGLPTGDPATPRTSAPRAAPPITVIAIASADGLGRTLASLGARVVRPSHGTRPSVGEIAEAILASGSAEVIVLPNDRDVLLAARHAAELTPLVRVGIIATRNAAEGMAAAVAFDAGASLDQNVARMTEESEALRTFTVFSAARDSAVDGQAVSRGDVIAIDADKRMLAREASIAEATLAALAAIGQLRAFDLVTCHHGAGLPAHAVEDLRGRILGQAPGVEVEMVPGGQRHDHLLVAVE